MLPQTAMNLKDEKLNRYFTILKIVLFCMPFLCIGYVGLGAGSMALDTGGVLAANPAMAVSFLAARLQPYAAWIAILAERRLADGRTGWAVVNLALLLWKSTKVYGCGVGEAFRACDKRAFVREAGGNLPLLALAGLCLFASLRLGIGIAG